MSAPNARTLIRPDSEALRVPDLSEWLGRIAQSDASIWASYVDYKASAERVQK